MKMKTFGYWIATLMLVLSLSGCDTKPEDIAVWKAKGNSKKLIKALGDYRDFVRVDAIKALGSLQSKEAVAPLAALFNDKNEQIVQSAVDAIAQIGGPDAEQFLLRAMQLDSVPACAAAAAALGSFPSDASIDALAASLDKFRYKQIAMAAIESLGRIGNPRAVEPLCATLKERSIDIRLACISSLQMIGGDAAIKGIIQALDDHREQVRDGAVEALRKCSPASVPFVLETLRDKQNFARASAVAVLKLVDAVPESGSDLVWYRLSELTADNDQSIDPAKAGQLASIRDSIPALLEGVMHASPEIREYAFLGLENIGQAAVEPAVAKAEAAATTEALEWFNQRSSWCGAPSWQLDLWGAVTALNPEFLLNAPLVAELKGSKAKALHAMNWEFFRPARELIPSLLILCREPVAEEAPKEDVPSKKKVAPVKTESCRIVAARHLAAAGYRAVYPLMAALTDAHPEVAKQAAEILIQNRNARVEQLLRDEFIRRMDAGMEIAGTPYHNAIVELDLPGIEPWMKKVRPNEAQVLQAFRKKFPGVAVESVPRQAEVDPALNMEPFLLRYEKNGTTDQLQLVYRLDAENNWVPDSPLPDVLP